MKNVKGDLQNDALRTLRQLNPERMTYDQWLSAGAALKGCGYGMKGWDSWSNHDPKQYHAGEKRTANTVKRNL